MPNPTHVCGDDDQFVNMQNEIAEAIARAKPNGATVRHLDCIACGEEIAEGRSKIYPYVERCLPCQQAKEDREAGLNRLHPWNQSKIR